MIETISLHPFAATGLLFGIVIILTLSEHITINIIRSLWWRKKSNL